MNPRRTTSAAWIAGPTTDLFFFSFGWIPALVAFVVADTSGFRHGGQLYLWALVFNFLHRHLTFPLVYGDPEQFARHRSAYLGLPVFFLVLTLFGATQWSALYLFLGSLAVAWTMYHTIMQKVGLLRIYSRKSGAGKLWLDKTLPFAWLAAGTLYALSDSSFRGSAADIFMVPLPWVSVIDEHASAVWGLAVLAGAVVLGLTLVYVREELQAPGPFSWPKMLYGSSILMLYCVFFYDVGIGYVVLGFSHAIEYIAFVNVYSRKKYGAQPAASSFMARVVRRQTAAMTVYGVVMGGAFLGLNSLSPRGLDVYIVGSGFLHFIYDGWIWKMREPAAGRPLEISYAPPGPVAGRGSLTSGGPA